VGEDNKAEIRSVQPAERVGKLWVIDSGLHPGDRVVVEGFSRVKSGATVNPKEAPKEEPAETADLVGSTAGSASSASPREGK
jgi:membrane fusion protein (multidrug efflux system)